MNFSIHNFLPSGKISIHRGVSAQTEIPYSGMHLFYSSWESDSLDYLPLQSPHSYSFSFSLLITFDISTSYKSFILYDLASRIFAMRYIFSYHI